MRTTHTRRDALLAGAAALTASITATARAGSRPARIRTRSSSHPNHAKNVIFMVSDGMSHGTLTLGDLALRRSIGEASPWISLWSRRGVRRALQDTASANSFVTDSSAAASAWGCGTRVPNGTVNTTSDNRELEPLLVTARAHGKRTGLVTTTTVTHATPAGFIANVPERGMEGAIAQQIQERGVDVVLGGGLKHFSADTINMRQAIHVRTKDELAGTPVTLDKPLLGLFNGSHIDYVVERPESQPTLEMMAKAALDRLSLDDNGFVLQIEGGRVDHAAHDNDAFSLLAEQLEFERTVKLVSDWIADRDDTLLIITSDHGNGNPGLTLYGREAAGGLAKLFYGSASLETMLAQATADGKDPDAIDRLATLLGERRRIDLNADEKEVLLSRLRGDTVNPFLAQNEWTSVLGSILANHYGVAFMSPNHTSDHVECTALGPGSQDMPAMILNTDLHAMVLSALGIEAAR